MSVARVVVLFLQTVSLRDGQTEWASKVRWRGDLIMWRMKRKVDWESKSWNPSPSIIQLPTSPDCLEPLSTKNNTSYFGTCHSLAMMGKAFDIQLILEFTCTATDVPIVEWIENVELVCELCTMDRVEHVLPLQLQSGTPTVYQRVDPEEIKRALMTAYATDAFNGFTAWWLLQNETVKEFLADLHCLAWFVGELLSKRWMTCAFMSGLP